MAISFSCTHCQTKQTTQDDSLAGALMTCVSCKQLTLVPLTCPHCRKTLQSDGRMGGKLIQCGVCNREFRVKLTHEELDQELDALGGRVGVFRQGQRSAALPSRDGALKEEVKGGYCEGICIDWLRRTVQKGRASYEPSPFHAGAQRTGAQIEEREQSQTRRGAQAWQQRFGDAKANALAEQQRRFDENLAKVKADTAADVKKVSDMRDRARDEVNRLVDLYNGIVRAFNACRTADEQQAISPQMDETSTRLEEARKSLERLNQQFTAASGQATTLVNATVAARNTEVSKTVLERIWPHYTAVMDSIESQNRLGTGRGTSKRPFSGLEVVLSVADQSWTSASAFGQAVLSAPSFAPYCGALIGFCATKKDEAGHAVAAYRLNTSDYLFFDPNVGVYQMSAAGVVRTLEKLFGTFYDGFSMANGGVKAGYTVFGHDGPTAPSIFKTTAAASVREQPVRLAAAKSPAAAAEPVGAH